MELDTLTLAQWLKVVAPFAAVVVALVAWIYRRTLQTIDAKANAEALAAVQAQANRTDAELDLLRETVDRRLER